MRYAYLTMLVVVLTLILLFAVQNVGRVTISFLAMSLTLPVGMLVLLSYVMGVVTGGSVLALMRGLIHGASRKP